MIPFLRLNTHCQATQAKRKIPKLGKEYSSPSAQSVKNIDENDRCKFKATKNNNEVISESEFINYAETLNLELIESKYSTQYFKVKEEVETGFEALEIANKIYESGKIQYSHPNFIAKTDLH